MNREQILDSVFWRGVSPAGIDQEFLRAGHDLRGQDLVVQHAIRNSGYFVSQDTVVDWRANRRLIDIMTALRERKIPLPFAFVYDEFWRAAHACHSHAKAALGIDDIDWFWDGVLNFWFDIGERRSTRVHRDTTESVELEGGDSERVTVWVPLTEATSYNGCIYAVPKSYDPGFQSKDFVTNVTPDFKEIRALPQKSGRPLIWTQNLLHWSIPSTMYAMQPRLAFAIEYCRKTLDWDEEDLLFRRSLDELPTFEERFWAIVSAIHLQKSHVEMTAEWTVLMDDLYGELRGRLGR